jgi:exodeoxyribonuclease V alpha subunit
VREIMVFLHSHGVGTARAVRIFKTYGADAIQVMSANPYRLARDIRGIGFKTADAIAMKLGIEKTAMIRVRAGISYALTEAMDEGHCGLPTGELVPLAEKLLEVPPELIRYRARSRAGTRAPSLPIRRRSPCVFLAGLHRAERTIAERLLRLANGILPWATLTRPCLLPESRAQRIAIPHEGCTMRQRATAPESFFHRVVFLDFRTFPRDSSLTHAPDGRD